MRNTPRNRAIVAAIIEDQRTLDSVGEEYGITRERVRQIVAHFRPDFSVMASRQALRDAVTQQRHQEREAEAESWRTRADFRERHDRTWSTDEMILCMQEIESERGYVGLPTWSTISRGEGVPSAALYVMRFGSWSEARRAAGLSVQTRRRTYRKDFTDEVIIASVAEFLRTAPRNHHQRFGAAHYEQWRKAHPEPRPSLSTIRVRMKWADAKHAAIQWNKSFFGEQ